MKRLYPNLNIGFLFLNLLLLTTKSFGQRVPGLKFSRLLFSGILFIFLGNGYLFGQITVSPAAGGNNVCVGGDYVSLGDIIVSETGQNDFGANTNDTYILTLPANFEFDNTVGTVSATSGTNISAISEARATSTFTVTFSHTVGAGSIDAFTITGLKIRAITAISSGNILESGGSSPAAGNGLAHGSLVSVARPNNGLTVTASSATICDGSSTTIDVALSVAGVNYQLRDNFDDSLIGAPVAGTGATINLPTGTLTSNTTFNVLSTNASTGCYIEQTTTPTVNVDVQPVANAGAGGDICGNGIGNPFMFTGVASTGTGLWTRQSGPAGETFIDNTSATTDVWVTTYGTYVFRWTETNGTCSDFDEITVDFWETPTVSAAGGDQDLCETATFTLAGNVAASGTGVWSIVGGPGVWSIVGGPGVITDASSPVTTVTGVTAGTGLSPTTLRWTITSGSCGSTQDDVVLNNYVQPVANAGAGGDICGNGIGNPFTFTGVASTGSGLWTRQSGPAGETFIDNTSATTDVWVTTYGTYVFRWTETNGTCNDFDEITVDFWEATVAQAGPAAVEECDLNLQLSGTQSIFGSTAAWTVFAGNPADITFSDNTLFNPTAISTIYGVYTFRLTETNGTCTSTDDIIVTYTEQPVAINSTELFVCSGNAFSFDPQDNVDSGNGIVSTFSWTATYASGLTAGAGTGTGLVAEALINNLNTQQNAVYTVIPTGPSGCIGSNFTITVPISPQPLYTGNLDATVCSDAVTGVALPATDDDAGAITSYDVSAVVGGGLTGTATTALGTSNVNLIAANVFNNVTNTADIVTYTITPYMATCVGTSFDIVVTVDPEPVYTGSLDATVCSDNAIAIVLPSIDDDAGVITSYDVSAVVGGGLTGVATTGIGTANVNLISADAFNNITNALDIVTYTITPYMGSCVGTSFAIIVTVDPEPVYTGNLDVTACSDAVTGVVLPAADDDAGAITSYDVSAVVGAGLTGAASTAMGTSNVNLIGGDIFNNVTNASIDVDYTITPYLGACTGTSFVITVTISPEPLYTGNLDATVCSNAVTGVVLPSVDDDAGAITSYDVTAVVGGGLTGTATTALGTSNVNLIAANVFNNVTNTADIVTYTITPYMGACVGTSFDIVVSVNPQPVITTTGNETICSGDITTVGISNSNSIPSATYSWIIQSSSNVIGHSAGGGNSISQILTSFDGNNQGSVTYRITPSNVGCDGNFVDVTVTVDPIPDIATNINAETICDGDNTSITISNLNGVSGTTFTWTVSQTGGAAGATNGSGAAISQTLSNATNTPGLVTYTITPSANGCDGSPTNVVVTVNPTPTIATSGDETLCSPDLTNISISNPNGVAGTTFSWVVSNVSNGILGASSGSGNLIAQTLTNPNVSTIGSVTYTVTPSANGCAGVPVDVIVTINPITIVDAGPDDFVCSDGVFVLAGNIFGGTSAGNWTAPLGDGSFDNSAFGVGTTYTPGATDITNGSVTILLTSSDSDGVGPCMPVIDSFVLTINPFATVAVPADYSVCEPTDITVAGTIGGSATLGSWSIVFGNGTLSTSSLTGSTVSAVYVPDVTDVNTTITLRLSTNDPDLGGPCLFVSQDLDIRIDESAKVVAGTDFEICGDDVAVLGGSITGSVSTGTWSIISGGSGTFLDNTDLTTSYIPSATDTLGSVVTLRLTSADPATSCGPVFDEVDVTINKLPVVFLSGLNPNYAENNDPVTMVGVPSGGVFSGTGTTGGSDQFDPGTAIVGSDTFNLVTYTYTEPVTGCVNTFSRKVVIAALTVIDFGLPAGIQQNLIGPDLELCADQGDVVIQATPLASSGEVIPVVTEIISVPDIGVFKNGLGEWTIPTDGLASGSYDFTYIYTNADGATTRLTKNVNVKARPIVDFVVDNFCIDTPITFTDLSYFPTSNFDTLVSSWFWEFRDLSTGVLITTSNLQNPTVTFGSAGNKEVQLIVESTLGCTNTFTDIILLGSKPTAAFSFDDVCDANATRFNDLSTTDGFTPIVSYTWDFGDGMVIGPAAPGDPVPGFPATTFQNPAHDYAGPGTRLVTLTITSDKGCMSTFAQQVSILESQTVSVTSSYIADFDVDLNFWAPNSNVNLATGARDSMSWIWGDLSTASTILQQNHGNVFWTGGAINDTTSTASYFANESSWVDGPCFDITGLARPMISIDHWVDTEFQTDGAVVQYSIDKGITWETIGALDNGINDPGVDWYNSQGIVSRPGEQSISQYGWSGIMDTTWVNSRYSLDTIPVGLRDEVRIRIAFSSNETNVAYFEGFAFDNVFIGEKERTVLLESFVNMQDQNIYTANMDEINKIEVAHPNDFVYINYHTETPSSDEFHLDNKIGPLARWGNYSISTHNKSFIDGNFKANVNTFNQINAANIDERSLVDPIFDITIEDLSPIGVTDQLTIKTSITAKDTLNASVIVHTAIIEKNVGDSAYNVFKKFLPNSDGMLLSLNWVQSDTWNNTAVWDMSSEEYVEVYDPDSLAVIAFVQRKTSPYEIYQTAYLDLARPYQGIDPVTGTLEDLLKVDAGTITMYPNPAKNQLTFAVPGQVSELLNFRIVDQRGVEMTQGVFRFETGKHSIDITNIPNGIYFVLIGTSDKPLVYHKLSIMRH